MLNVKEQLWWLDYAYLNPKLSISLNICIGCFFLNCDRPNVILLKVIDCVDSVTNIWIGIDN